MAVCLRPTALEIITWLTVVSITQSVIVYRSPSKCGKNYSFNAPKMRAIVKHVGECENLCRKLNNCKSFQVSSTKKTCQLLKRTAGEWSTKMTPRKGWAYREVVGDRLSDSCRRFPFRDCSPVFSSFGQYVDISRSGTWGAFMKDSVINNSKYYYITGNGNERYLYEYADYDALFNDIKSHYYLPFGCHGAQPIVRDNKLWCKEYNNRKVVIYDLIKREILARISFDSVLDDAGTVFYAGYSDQCHYDWGGQSDIDVASDYGGMVYIIWGRQNKDCDLAVSEIDPDTYEIRETHWMDIDKRGFGTGFAVCGRLYFTDHYQNDPASNFQLIWDLRTGNFTWQYFGDQQHTPGYLRFPARHNYNGMTDFNPVDERVYKHQNERLVSMKVNFDPRPDDFFLPPK